MSAIEKVRSARETLDHALRLVGEARINLYDAVKIAHEGGMGPSEIAQAAGWKTKKAVYDAIQAARDE